MFEVGDIIEFNYLWAREADKGEESGRKTRPACVAVKSSGNPANLYLFAITSTAPLPRQRNIAVPELECRRVGLSQPAWVITSEFNRTRTDELYDVMSMTPLARFSDQFMEKLSISIRAAGAAGELRQVDRS